MAVLSLFSILNVIPVENLSSLAYLKFIKKDFIIKNSSSRIDLILSWWSETHSLVKNSNTSIPFNLHRELSTDIYHFSFEYFHAHVTISHPSWSYLLSYWMQKLISSRIAGPGELFSSDFQACAQSPCWATRCSLGSVSCSCDAAPRRVVHKQALPVASSLLSEQKNVIDICRRDRNLSSKSLASYFQSKKRNSKVVRRRSRKKKKNNSIDLRRAFTSASVDRSSISSTSVTADIFSQSVVFGVFKFVPS